MTPLRCPALETTRPSKTEQCLAWIPVLGWTLARALEQARFRPLVQSIKQQLRNRGDTSELWGPEPGRQRASATLRRILQEEFGWINDHFIPEDPLDIVCWAHRDGLDGASFITRLEQAFGISLTDADWERVSHDGSLNDLLRLLTPHDPGGKIVPNSSTGSF